MIHTYQLNGVSDAAAAARLAEILRGVSGIVSVQADVTIGTAVVTLDRHIRQDELNATLRATLGPNVFLSEERMVTADEAPPAGWRAFLPLIGAFALILGFVGVRLALADDGGARSAMNDFMAGFFLIFGALKLLRLRDFAEAYATYDLLAARSRAYALAYPFIELALGTAYLLRLWPTATSLVAFALMTVGAVGVGRALRRKERIACACLGTVFKLPMTKVTLFEDLLMAAMAVAALLS